MDQWGLTGKVSAVVTDNAANAINSVRDLDMFLVNSGVTCAAHSLQLVVTKMLKINEIAGICEKVSGIVGHFLHSNIASTALEGRRSN